MSDQNPQGSAFTVRDLTPQEVAEGLQQGRLLLVDVREPNETALERIPGSVLVPLSAFDPGAVPDPSGREVVFSCRSGRRSVTASLAAQEQGFSYASHLAGGILAWKAAGLPTET
jgi:rhodanese-related sulfurtransferase